MGENDKPIDDFYLNELQTHAHRSLYAIDQVDALARAIFRLSPQLKSYPDPVIYQDLVDAIEEVVKSWDAINDAIKEVWKLYSEDGDLKTESLGLLDIGGYALPAMVEQKRGHCQRIADIYFGKLHGWFTQSLTYEDQRIMGEGFSRLSEADEDFFHKMVLVADATDQVANQILDLVESDQPDQAREIAKGLRRQLRPVQKAINQSLIVLRRVQTEFTPLAPDDEVQPTIVVEGDYIAGDNIEVGDIIDSTGVAIGRDAKTETNPD